MSNGDANYGQSRLVTGDAVVLDLHPAGFASRMVAIFLDVTVQFVSLIAATVVVLRVSEGVDLALTAAIQLLLTVLILVGYPVAFETFTRGRSLGKLAMGLRVVGRDGSPVRFRQALARALTGVVEIWLASGVIALISSLLNREGRRVGDFLAGTVVVQERTGRRPGTLVEMPPAMAGWARNAELSRLPAETATMAHQYLTRYTELNEQTRYEMGVRLADTVTRYVAPPPPPQASPPEYLAAVLAERRRREEARLAQQRENRA
ncbi:RDD family protein [Actinorugispora endophytica]|uniref:Putative RDD family membrane protein YckC n=1 Tax=Actinorugispora endophytica TaxID=1605990 RepID=A0A4R6UX57_9ACTN|nr:RDD family protein [Actinorugispora endophytica]TDQ51952.1 putative RDD family membrane protein YckC [Actinorugispora endophytica]